MLLNKESKQGHLEMHNMRMSSVFFFTCDSIVTFGLGCVGLCRGQSITVR